MGRAWQRVRTDIEQPREGEVNIVINGKRCIIEYTKSAKKYHYIIKIVFKDSETTASTHEL